MNSWGKKNKVVFLWAKRLVERQFPCIDIPFTSSDVLFSRKNTCELVGACAFIYNAARNLFIPDTVFKLDFFKDKLTGEYLAHLINDQNFRRRVQMLASGSAGSMPNISKDRLSEFYIPVPPLELQRRYSTIARYIEQQKSNSENLFQSLMQQAFKGELVR